MTDFEVRRMYLAFGGHPGRSGTWYWRLWWKIGYHGPYQLNWWIKRRLGDLYMHDYDMWHALRTHPWKLFR